MLFKDRLKTWRKSSEMRQKEACVVFDVPCGTYRSWENGKRTPNKLAMESIEQRIFGMVPDAKGNPPFIKRDDGRVYRNPNWLNCSTEKTI